MKFLILLLVTTSVQAAQSSCLTSGFTVVNDASVSYHAGFIGRPTSDGTIYVYWRCYGQANSQNHIYLLNGPEPANQELYSYAANLYIYNTSLHVCTTDYRGVGCSSAVSCGNATSPEICLEQFSNVTDFYTEQAVQDVIAVAKMFSGQTTFYGVGYGSYLLIRLQQLWPSELSSPVKWIFDGAVIPPWFYQGGRQWDFVRQNDLIFGFALGCNANSNCSKYFNIDQFLYFWIELLIQPENTVTAVSNAIKFIFTNPQLYEFGFIQTIFQISELVYTYDWTDFQFPQIGCTLDNPVLKIVEANELYDWNFSYTGQLPFNFSETGCVQHWAVNPVSDETPFNQVSGEVWILDGEWNFQTPENSETLANYFNQSVIWGYNWGQNLSSFENPTNQNCGILVLSDIVNGYTGKYSSCLNESIFPTYGQVNYPFVSAPTGPFTTPTSSNYIRPSWESIVIPIFVGSIFIMAFTGYIVYSRCFGRWINNNIYTIFTKETEMTENLQVLV
jgi:hypothetical protein